MKEIHSFTELKRRKAELTVEMEESKKEISRISAELNPIRLIKENTEKDGGLSILRNLTTILPLSFVILPKIISFLPINKKWKFFLKGVPIFYNYIIPAFQESKKDVEHRMESR